MGFAWNILAFLVAFLAMHLYIRSRKQLGADQMKYVHYPGPCRIVEGADFGTEDLTVTDEGRVFIAHGLEYSGKGSILTMDSIKSTKATPLEIKGHLDIANFQPHGLSAYKTPAGRLLIYVINHNRGNGQTVEKFEYVKSKQILSHLTSITDPLFDGVPNDLHVIEEDKFYIANSLQLPEYLYYEIISPIKTGRFLYYDGTRASIITSNLFIPNGVTASLDKKYIYLANAYSLDIYKRNTNNSLEFLKSVEVDSLLDNLDVDPSTGDLWVGASPSVGMDHGFSPAPNGMKGAWAQVLRLCLSKENVDSIEETLLDDGHYIYTASVAVRRGSDLLVGTVTNKLLYCEIKHISGM